MVRSTGLNASVERIFGPFPVIFPLILVGIGVVFFIPAIPVVTGHAKMPILPAIMALLIGGIGVVALPFGVHKAVKRHLSPIVLVCPKCRMESRTSSTPFNIQKWSDVDYANITCSACGADFTVPRNARLL